MNADQLATIGNAIQQDPALTERLTKTTDKQEALKVFVEAGKKQGFSYSADEYETALNAGSANRPKDGELSDQQLETVAGGAWYHDAWYKLVTTGGYACK